MKKLLTIILAATCGAVCAIAQTNAPTFIRGGLEINYASRANPGKVATPDVYTFVNLNVCNSAVFSGTIKSLPIIPGTFGISQQASLAFDVGCDIVNPNNPAQTRNIGRIAGNVAIDPDGKYRFSDGSLKFALTTSPIESRFSGIANGRPLIKQQGWFDRLKGEAALSITRMVNGKPVNLTVSKFDRMVFQQHVLGQGPLQSYPETTVNGEMVYDYERSTWFFRGVTMSYYHDGGQKADSLSGNIRWIAKRGEYEFDVRFNERPPNATEASVFSAQPNQAAVDEAAFFAVDTSVQALTGAMKYRDTKVKDTVAASSVAVDLVGNKLTKQQVMNAFKLIMISSIVPINAE